jgi:hypothetical protein
MLQKINHPHTQAKQLKHLSHNAGAKSKAKSQLLYIVAFLHKGRRLPQKKPGKTAGT